FTDGFLEIADHIYDIPTARWGGATANTVGLLANIGPLEERQPSYGLAGTPKGNDSVGKIMSQPTDMGPVEFIKMIYAINPNASFMFVLPIDVQTAEESLNFTRFLLDDKNESEWGALRASLGIENPVNLLGYEIGNEEYFRAEPSMNSAEEGYDEYIVSDEYISYRDAAIDRYVNTCIANISAIHSVYPEVKMYPCVNGVTTRVSATAWNSAVATRICNQPGVDGVAYHAYYSTYATTTSTNTKQMDKIQNLFVTLTGEKTKFVYTEHALWSSDESVKRQSFYSALSEPYFINSMQMRDDVISANYHNIVCKSNLTSPGTWAFFTKKIDKYYENGINKVYKLYTENMGNKIVRSTTTIDSTHKSYISFLPTKKEDGSIVLSLTNYYADRNMNIDFTLNDEYELVKESVFTAPNFTSIVYGESTKDVFTVTNTYRGGETFSSYTLPNKSLAILTLKKKGSSYDENLTYTTNNILNETFESYSITPTPFTLVKDSGVNSVNAFGSWNLKTYVNVAYNENTKASIVEGKKLKLTPTAVAYTASGFPVLEYGGDLSSLTNYFKISFDYDKNSTTSGGGVKFMIHNSGRNYYVLWLSGLKEERYKWIFNKVENNTIVDTVYGETYTNYNDTPDLVKEAENGYLNGLVSANDKSYFLTNYSLNRGTVSPNNTKSGPIHNTGTVNIEYNNGKITWAIDGYEYNMIQYNSTGSY
ncbi:MAG: hypothetical protein IJQ28_08100, partial [Clostridia bacterium]|nr:hypothetical protein [Clostridia bacterium]